MNVPRPSRLPRALAAAAVLFALSLPTFAARAPAPDEKARRLVAAALQAMGGEEKIRGLHALHFEANGTRNALEQSERPEGPWIVQYEQISEDRDYERERLRKTTSAKFATYVFTQTLVAADGVVAMEGPGGQKAPFAPGAEEWLELGPERVLLTALAADDLRAGADVPVQGVPHHEVDFTWRGAPVRVFLNADTSLPTAVEVTRPYAYDYFGVWGDVTTRTLYSAWKLCQGGVRLPLQWDVEQNGLPARSMFITKLTLGPQLADDLFAIPEQVKQAYHARVGAGAAGMPLGRPDRPPVEVSKGILQIPGGFNTTIVRQDDGVVILEAPVSSDYSAKVIAEAQRRFPGLPIKAAVTTSDAWPHLGGVREYVARGIPVYALDANLPILNRLLEAPFRTSPDSLARSPRKPDFRVVSGKTVVGSGANRMEIYPIRTETGERQMMVYFPELRLLYASDLAQPANSGDWTPSYYDELRGAVDRTGLKVETIFAMHMTPVPWASLLAEIEKAAAAN